MCVSVKTRKRRTGRTGDFAPPGIVAQGPTSGGKLVWGAVGSNSSNPATRYYRLFPLTAQFDLDAWDSKTRDVGLMQLATFYRG